MSCLVPSPFPTVPPFPYELPRRVLRRRCYPQTTQARIPVSLPRIRRSFRLGLIDWHYLGGLQQSWTPLLDEVGLSSVNVVNHCVQATPPDTLMVQPSYPSIDSQESWIGSQGFSRFRSLAHHPGRNATPPKPSSLGPFIATGYPATLAAYPHRLLRSGCGRPLPLMEFEQRFPDEHGLARVGLSSTPPPFFMKPHRL